MARIDDDILYLMDWYRAIPLGPDGDAARERVVRKLKAKLDATSYDQLPRCPWCRQPDDECRCAFMWRDGERVPLPGRAEMTPPGETEPPRRA